MKMRLIAGATLHCSMLLQLLTLVATSISNCNAEQFNYEVEKRVLERLDFYLGGPVETNKILNSIRTNGGFANNLEAQDRDVYLSVAYSMPQPLVYYALEDGTISGYYWSNGYYREPGNAGYSVDSPEMQKHLVSCVDKYTGAAKQCILPAGGEYVSCRDGLGDERGLCERMDLCPNQPGCEANNDEECKADLKWCRQYIIKKAPSNGDSDLGFVPLTNYCLNSEGQFSQELDQVLSPLGESREVTELTSCMFDDDGWVQRSLQGDYAGCGNDEACDTVFAGGYESNEYDPRYRPWYITTKDLQKPNWLPPFTFFSLAIGITYAEPIYSQEEETGRSVFAGVLAVDYRFEDIAQFLIDSYGNSSTAVVIFEDAAPNYLIGASTGSDSARFFLTDDLARPCPVLRGDGIPCTPVRVSVRDLEGDPMDTILVKSFESHFNAGFPEDLLVVKVSKEVDSDIYMSQSTLYIQAGAELAWRVIIVAPGGSSDIDSITADDPVFVVICVVGALGFLCCCGFLWIMYSKRGEKAFVYADWRFTCAFIFGCILLNGSTFTLLGENTDTACLLRVWTFHLFFVMALAPLFVKIWRIWKLIGTLTTHLRRHTITNATAIMYTMPLIILQVVILLVFTFVDPPKQTEIIETEDGIIVQRIVCDTDTAAFFVTQAIFEAGLVFIGCVLAFMTRDMQDDFGEAKQLLFAMYNIAFVAIIVVVVVQVAGLDGKGTNIMQAVGVFWGTVFSAGAFVIPRMLQVREMKKDIRTGRTSSNVRVSGLDVGPSCVAISSVASSIVPQSILERIEESNHELNLDEDFDSSASDEKYADTSATSLGFSSGQEQAKDNEQAAHRVDWTGAPLVSDRTSDH